MPLYKVALHRRMRENYDGRPEANPFLRRMPPPDVFHTMMVREWTFEADDEAHVRRLLDQARDLGLVAVEGFTLRSIEEVK